jgi:hypothetical protein
MVESRVRPICSFETPGLNPAGQIGPEYAAPARVRGPCELALCEEAQLPSPVYGPADPQRNSQEAAFRRGVSETQHRLIKQRSVTYHPEYGRVLRNVNAAILFEYFFQVNETDSDGWFVRQKVVIEKDLGMTREQVDTARRCLRTAGVLEERDARLEHRLYYRLNIDAMTTILSREWDSHSRGRRKATLVYRGNSADVSVLSQGRASPGVSAGDDEGEDEEESGATPADTQGERGPTNSPRQPAERPAYDAHGPAQNRFIERHELSSSTSFIAEDES